MYLQARTVTLLGPQPAAATPSSTSTSSSSSSSATTTPTLVSHTFVAPAPSSTSTDAPASKSAGTTTKSINKGPIIGGVIGGVLFVTICALLLWIFLRGRRNRNRGLMTRGFTPSPLLGSPANGNEKWAMDNSPDPGESRKRKSGGVFGPFGGYHKTPSVEEREQEEEQEREVRRPMEVDDPTDAPIPDTEKSSLVAPALEEHPALHPLPGVAVETPTYYPGGPQHPAYNTLPSQRGRHPTHVTLPGQQLHPEEPMRPEQSLVPERSPEIPDFEFSPVELLPEDDFDSIDAVPLTPQAELAAFPSPPRSIASQLSKLKRHTTPPCNTRPRRTSTPPRHSLPLDRLTPPPSQISPPKRQRPSPPRKSQTGQLSISTLSRKLTSRPLRPRTMTYPSPTAGGRPELPASMPPPFVSKTPKTKNPHPAFHHISLPSPQEPPSASSILRNESTKTSYSIPIGLSVDPSKTPSTSHSQQQPESFQTNWPLTTHPVTSDAHHLREQPSYVSALSSVRDLYNSSAVSALTTTSEVPEAELEATPQAPLHHNHSMDEWKPQDRQRHVMSWQNYSTCGSPITHEPEQMDDDEPGHEYRHHMHDGEHGSEEHQEGETEVSPMFSPPQSSPAGHGLVSPMLSPPLPGQAGYRGWSHYGGESSQPDTPVTLGIAERLSIKVGLTPMIGGKKFSQRSLEKRARELREEYSDLSVQPLNPGRRWDGARKVVGSGRSGRKSTY